jgi:hypothetical protein
MWNSLLAIILMGGMFLIMLNKGKLASTHRMALLPLIVCGIEMWLFGSLQVGFFPILSVILWAARLCIVACCVLKLRQDAGVMRRRARRKALEERRAVTDLAAKNVTFLPNCA